MNRLLVAVGSGLSAVFAFTATAQLSPSAKTYYWTGAEDARWTNAANWVESDGTTVATVPPGVVGAVIDAGTSGASQYQASWTGHRDDTAIFDGEKFASGAATTIDLSGHLAVGSVIVRGATTPVVTFGTGKTNPQALRLSEKGRFKIDSDVVNMPVVTYPGLGGVLDVTSTYTIYYENQAAGRTFVFPATAKETYAGTTQYGKMYLEGCGHFELNGGISHQSQFTPILNQSGAGELWVTNFTSTITGFQVYSSDSTKRNIHLAKGSYLRTNNRAYGQFVFATDTRIDGEGYIRMADSSNLSKGNYPLNVSTANIRVDIDTKLQLETNPAEGKTAADYSCDFTGSTGAILALNYPENDIPGDVRVKYIGLEVAKIGAPGEASSLGVGTNIRLRRGTLRLKGDGETTTRPIFFESTDARGGGFVYLGTNKWTVASEFTFEAGSGHAPCTCSSVEPEGVLEIMNPFVDNTTTAVTSDGLTMANPGRGTVIWHGANTFRNWWRFGETGQSGFKSKVIIPPDASFTCVRPGKNLLFYKCDVVVQGGVETAAPDLNRDSLE